MELVTKHFGALVVSEGEMITFEQGLPGFPNDKRFIIIFDESADNKIYWLQSMDNGEVAFALVDSFDVMPEYDPMIDESAIEEVGSCDIENLIVFNVVIIGDSLAESFVNMKAPIIINNSTKKGKQVLVSNDEYYINHRLLECIESEGRV